MFAIYVLVFHPHFLRAFCFIHIHLHSTLIFSLHSVTLITLDKSSKRETKTTSRHCDHPPLRLTGGDNSDYTIRDKPRPNNINWIRSYYMCWERRECSKKFVVAVSGLTKGKKKKGSSEGACTVPQGLFFRSITRNQYSNKKNVKKRHTVFEVFFFCPTIHDKVIAPSDQCTFYT